MIKTPDHESGRVSFFLSWLSHLNQRGAVAGTASADVESANICGFQSISIPQGWSFRTVTFKEVGSTDVTKSFDLTDIKVLKANGSEWEASPAGLVNNVSIQKISTSGAYGTKYTYSSTKTSGVVNGWRENGTRKIDKGEVTFKKGEGIIIFFNKEISKVPVESCLLQVAGEVELLDTTVVIPQGWSFSGNNTPVPIDLTEVGVVKADGSEWEASPAGLVNNVSVQKISTTGAYGTKYTYSSTKTSGVVNGWRENGTRKIVKGEVALNPGEGFIVFFNKEISKVPVESCKLVMPKCIK